MLEDAEPVSTAGDTWDPRFGPGVVSNNLIPPPIKHIVRTLGRMGKQGMPGGRDNLDVLLLLPNLLLASSSRQL